MQNGPQKYTLSHGFLDDEAWREIEIIWHHDLMSDAYIVTVNPKRWMKLLDPSAPVDVEYEVIVDPPKLLTEGRMPNSKIAVSSGRLVDPLDLQPEDIDITDIGHALSNICRFTGQCKYFYSVAQHSVNVMLRVRSLGADVAIQLAALLHDASEAYIADIASPLKHTPVFEPYRLLESTIQYSIFRRFKLGDERKNPLIRQADYEMLVVEKALLFPPGQWPEIKDEPLSNYDCNRAGLRCYPMHPENARTNFMSVYRLLNDMLTF